MDFRRNIQLDQFHVVELQGRVPSDVVCENDHAHPRRVGWRNRFEPSADPIRPDIKKHVHVLFDLVGCDIEKLDLDSLLLRRLPEIPPTIRPVPTGKPIFLSWICSYLLPETPERVTCPFAADRSAP